jgi:hypothetical protein
MATADTITVMAKKSSRDAKADSEGGDRHKPSRMARIRKLLADALQQLADEEATDFTEEANNAVRFYLRHKGKFPGGGRAE